MKLLGVLAFAVVATCAMPAVAATSTVDFTGIGTNNGDPISSASGSGADFTFETRSGFGKFVSTVAPNVEYRADADYSQDQALYSATDDGVFELAILAQPGQIFTDITFGFGGFQNAVQTTDWEAWSGFFGTFINDGSITTDPNSSTLLTFAGVNTDVLLLQFGTNANVGLNFVTYTTTATATTVTPIPGTLLLFGTSLTGLIALRRRRPTRA
jgi:hypothetical protein